MKKPSYRTLANGNLALNHDWLVLGYLVPKDVEFNGASVPKWLQWLIPRDGSLLYASFIHDWMYRNAIDTKQIADKLFYHVAINTGVNKVLAYLAYIGVKYVGKGKY